MIKKYETMEQAYKCLRNDLDNRNFSFAYIVHNETVVLDGITTKADEAAVKELGLKMYFLSTAGGVIILQKGNISTCFIGEYRSLGKMLERYTDAFIEWLNEHGLNAVRKDNDILVNGYKICAFSNNRDPKTGWGIAPMTFTLNIDLDIVYKVCNKPIEKQPKGLSEFGITADMILEFINSFERGV